MAFAAIFLPLTTQYLFSVSMACTDTSNTHTNIPHTHIRTQAEVESSLGRVREGPQCKGSSEIAQYTRAHTHTYIDT